MHQYVDDALHNNGADCYIKTSLDSFSYNEVYDLALTFQTVLQDAEIKKNERVVIYASKNMASIAMMIACSKCECIYVPVSAMNPANRTMYIINETSSRFILCDRASELELKKTSLSLETIFKDAHVTLFRNSSEYRENSEINEAAFILFTSGSTGTPKGVVVSHEAAIAFVDWAATEFEITCNDIIASIAPFNFDLSVFDIYVTAKKAATLLLYSESETKNALLMAQQISIDKISTIYATPTFYSTLAHYGKLHKFNYNHLKNVLFAGEVFHLENFKLLLNHWPDKNYTNLYGPTETNVCTFFKINAAKINFSVFPIGINCSYANLLLVDEEENEINDIGMNGELLVAGPSLFNCYWNDPQKSSASMFKNKNGILFYRTGDLVNKNENGELVYIGRKDRMIKKNGFRIEPSEIEMILTSYPNVSNAAVLFSKSKNQLICFVEFPEHRVDNLNDVKEFCQKHLPAYMIPDKFVILESLPQTTSGKIDLQALQNQL